jgi:hypothetical protein
MLDEWHHPREDGGHYKSDSSSSTGFSTEVEAEKRD